MCPKCRKPTLTPLSVARSVPEQPHQIGPSRCTDCHGVWLPHEAIVLTLTPSETDGGDAPAESGRKDAVAGTCPAGHGFLTRARAESSRTFFLDRCAACRGIWFDAGEWAAVSAGEWLRHLDDLWDPVYRKKLRDQTEHEHRLITLRSALGDDAFEKVMRAADVLRDHPASSVALAYLLDEVRQHHAQHEQAAVA